VLWCVVCVFRGVEPTPEGLDSGGLSGNGSGVIWSVVADSRGLGGRGNGFPSLLSISLPFRSVRLVLLIHRGIVKGEAGECGFRLTRKDFFG
jgi:hypothetical protein